MSERNERIRDAFHDDGDVTEWNRDGVLSGVLQHTHRVRRQRIYRLAGVSLVTAVVLGVAWVQLRVTPAIPSIPTTFDSISTNPAEAAVTTQENQSATTITVQESPPNLIPLLGHRSALSNDLKDLVEKREEYSVVLNANPGRARADELRATIAGIDADIAATRTALNVVDKQLAALQGVEPVTTREAITYASEAPPIVIRGPVERERMMLFGGIALAALLIVFMALAHVRRTMRSAIDALTSLQSQASTQMSALTAGIEAIAIEVERLGENQRFMSKVIVGESKEGAQTRGNA
jgi:hypothetical protein